MVLVLLSLPPARAQQAEVKEAAQSFNCKPTKLEVMKQVTGRMPETLYKVSCATPKDAFVLVQCRNRTCTVIR
ncbi:hypothetical protein CHU95_19470 [Niveispirillum lacus]|uniref:PepSY domain-containing protein n=2 Tax=Niveispirillum lacus TaxID=1981099 RepID=A0A255YRD3_9PROT|nr:hypothetical protein CHU95_19470 [Niveispirillum lacus]